MVRKKQRDENRPHSLSGDFCYLSILFIILIALSWSIFYWNFIKKLRNF